MPHRITKASDGELITEQLNFSPQIAKRQQNQQDRKPACRVASLLRVTGAINQGISPRV